MKISKLFFGISMALALAACNGDDKQVYCTEELRPGIRVEVFNDAGEIMSCGVRIEATRDDGYSEVIHHGDEEDCETQESFSGLWEESGLYELTVQSQGFELARVEDIMVGMTGDGCHVITEEITVTLNPL